MYAYLKGIIVEVHEENCIIEVNHIGYNIKISNQTAGCLKKDETIKIYTYTYVREDALLLFGFLTKEDLEIFKKCITVNGIGPKGALSILNIFDANSLKFAIFSGDAKSIAKAPGIGAKTAERLILDLKDKIEYNDVMIDNEIKSHTSLHNLVEQSQQEALEALIALGYGQVEATNAIKRISNIENKNSSVILKEALKNIFA